MVEDGGIPRAVGRGLEVGFGGEGGGANAEGGWSGGREGGGGAHHGGGCRDADE